MGADFSARAALAPGLLYEPAMDGLLSLTRPDGLPARFRKLRETDAFVSLVDAAAQLEVPEAELVAAMCGEGVLRLDGPFGDLVRALPTLGRVRAVTRNAHATIETHGAYPTPDVGCAGLAGEVGARFLPEQWQYGYALDESVATDGHPMLCFYDGRGHVVHEIHAGVETNHAVFAKLVDLFACFDQSAGEQIVLAAPHLLAPRCDVAAWLRNAESARPVGTPAVSLVLEAARRAAIPVSVAVRSSGVVQRFSGLLHDVITKHGTLELFAPWVRVTVAIGGVSEVWTVRAPSLDGPVTSLEVLDPAASIVMSLSAARWPGKPEPADWRELIEHLPTIL